MSTAIKPMTQDPGKVTIAEEHDVASAYNQDPGQVIGTIQSKANPLTEYTSSRPRDITSGMVRALPRFIDDITRDFGWDLYERMILDPQVASIVDVIRMGACYNGFQLAQPNDVADEDKELASEILSFIQYNWDNLDRPIRQVAYELTAGIYLGHKVGEKVYHIDEIDSKRGPQLLMSGVHTKPGNAIAFVADDKNNVLGLISTIPGHYTATTFIPIDDKGQIEQLIPRDKFVVFTNDPENGDPRGTSVLRSIYQEWWMKMQLKPVYLQFLSTQAIPSVVGSLAEGAQPTEALDPLTFEPTGLMVDPAIQMRDGLETVQNGGVIVLPFGATAAILQTQVNTGQVFITAFDMFDKHIAKGISKQTLATEEATHQSRAASQVQQDVLGMPTERVLQTLCEVLREDMVRPLVLYNYGPDAARRLCPMVSSQEINQQDFSTASSGFKSIADAGIFDTSNFDHLAWAMDVLGGPAPVQEEFDAKQEELAKAQDAMQQAALAKAQQPAGQKPPVNKQGGSVGQGETGPRPGESGVVK